MAKRFVDTDIWTQNKWFRKLDPKFKLLWFYLITNCDSVGVWEEDMELASFIIREDYDIEKVLEIFKNQIKVVNGGKKWWIVDFCNFQYGQLKDNPNNKPHTSYINLLKKHGLYIDYTKGIHRVKDKDKDKEKETDKAKDYSDVDSVIDYLNEKAGSGYRHSKSSREPISGRLGEGFSVDDCKMVIDFKVNEWLDTKMEKFIRPETLFGPKKFEGYLFAAKKWDAAGRPSGKGKFKFEEDDPGFSRGEKI